MLEVASNWGGLNSGATSIRRNAVYETNFIRDN